MRIITFNLNGIRSAAKKGFFDWLPQQHADIICVQETKAQLEKLNDEIFRPKGYHSYFCDAEKPGYAGVGIYTRQEPKKIIHSCGLSRSDSEGRFLQVDFPNLSVISLYMPSGTSGEERQKIKYEFMDHFFPYLKKILKEKRDYIVCADWNIANTNLDLKNWRTNQKNSGFLPEERVWITKVLDLGWVDAFRVVNQASGEYTFWSRRSPTTWDNNVGWRIDYQLISPELKNKVKAAHIYKEQRFSDHAPLIIDYDV